VKVFLLVVGLRVVALAVVGLTLRLEIARTGPSAWDWRIAPYSSAAIHDSYYLMAIHPVAFVVLLLIGVALCIYAFRIAA
jgi:hypothetical protein